jgi:hypothetical protein
MQMSAATRHPPGDAVIDAVISRAGNCLVRAALSSLGFHYTSRHVDQLIDRLDVGTGSRDLLRRSEQFFDCS